MRRAWLCRLRDEKIMRWHHRGGDLEKEEALFIPRALENTDSYVEKEFRPTSRTKRLADVLSLALACLLLLLLFDQRVHKMCINLWYCTMRGQDRKVSKSIDPGRVVIGFGVYGHRMYFAIDAIT